MFVGRNVQELLKSWKFEAKNPHLCLYKKDGDTLIIFTDHPGYMIGMAGKLAEKYRNKIAEASFGTIKHINFVETHGIF